MRGQMGGHTSALELLKATGFLELVSQNPMVSIGTLSVIAAIATAAAVVVAKRRARHGIAPRKEEPDELLGDRGLEPEDPWSAYAGPNTPDDYA